MTKREIEERLESLEQVARADSQAPPPANVTGLVYLEGVQCGPGYDNGPLIQAAAEASQPRGKTFLLPPCDIYYSTPLDFTLFRDIIFQGQGGQTAGAPSATRLIYYGAATGEEGAINCAESTGIQFRDLQLLYTTDLEGGTLVNWTGEHSESAYGGMEHVFIGGDVENSTCGTLVDLEAALDMRFVQVNFQFAQSALRGITEGGFSNGNGFYDCVFVNMALPPVQDPGEGWTFINPTVEALRNGEAGFVNINAGVTGNKSLAVYGGWMGDVAQPANEGDWFRWSGPDLQIIGTEIGGGATVARLGNEGPVTGFTLRAHCNSQRNLLAVEASTEHAGWDVRPSYINTGPVSWQAGGMLPDRSIIDSPKGAIISPGMLFQHEGAISDASFGLPPPDGTEGYDFKNHKLWVRSGGAWKSVELT